MQNGISKVLFLSMLLIPAGLIITLPYLGSGHPLEEEVLVDVRFLNESRNTTEVVFFGYAECAFICPKSLFTLSAVMDSLKQNYPETALGGYFVDVNSETQIARANEYSTAFSEYIRGINTSAEELQQLKEQFHLNILKSEGIAEEIYHTDHFFVMSSTPEGWMTDRILANDTSEEIIYRAIEQTLTIDRNND